MNKDNNLSLVFSSEAYNLEKDLLKKRKILINYVNDFLWSNNNNNPSFNSINIFLNYFPDLFIEMDVPLFNNLLEFIVQIFFKVENIPRIVDYVTAFCFLMDNYSDNLSNFHFEFIWLLFQRPEFIICSFDPQFAKVVIEHFLAFKSENSLIGVFNTILKSPSFQKFALSGLSFEQIIDFIKIASFIDSKGTGLKSFLVFMAKIVFLKAKGDNSSQVLIKQSSLFDELNSILSSKMPLSIWDIYSVFLDQFDDINMINIALSYLNSYYLKNNDFVVTQEILYRLILCINRPSWNILISVNDWFFSSIIKEKSLITSFFSLMISILQKNRIVPSTFFSPLTENIRYPRSEYVQFSLIVSFLINIIESKIVSYSLFRQSDFAIIILDEYESQSIASDLLSYPEFVHLLEIIMISEPLSFWESEKRIKKLVSTLNHDKNNSLLSFFSKTIFNIPHPLVIYQLLTMIPSKYVESIFLCASIDDHAKIIQLFLHSGYYRALVNRFGIDPIFTESVLKIIIPIVLSTGNHFFDEMILSLDESHPIFKFKSQTIESFLESHPPDVFPFPIPSLLVNHSIRNLGLIHNHYLYSKYSIPSYMKCGCPLDQIPNIIESMKYFINPMDFWNLLSTKPQVVDHLLKPSQILPSLYETPNRDIASWISIGTNLSSFCFYIYFISFSDEEYPIININSSSIYLKDNKLLNHKKVPISILKPNKWYQFSFISQLLPPSISFYIDSSFNCSLPGGNSFFVHSIGSSTKISNVSFYVSSRLYGSTKTWNLSYINHINMYSSTDLLNCIKLHGSTILSPIQQLSDILEFDTSLNHLSILFENELKESSLSLYLPFFCFVYSNPNLCHLNITKEFIFHIISNKEIVKSDVFVFVCISIASIPHSQTMMYCLSLLLTDFEIWSYFGDGVLESMINVINSSLKGHIDSTAAQILFDNGCINFLIYTLFLNHNKGVNESVYSLLYTLFYSIDVSSTIQSLIGVIESLSMFSPLDRIYSSGASLNNDILNRFFSSGPIQSRLFKQLIKIEKQKFLTFIPDEIRLYILLISETSFSLSVFFDFMKNNPSSEFIIDNLLILSHCITRYVHEIEFWEQFTSLIVGEQIIDAEDHHQYTIQRSYLVPVLFDLVMTVISSFSNQEKKNQILSLSRRIIVSSQFIFMQKSFIPFFMKFIRGGHCDSDDLFVRNVFKNDQNQKCFAETFSDWKKYLSKIYMNNSVDFRQSNEFLGYSSSLLIELMTASNKPAQFVQFVANFADPVILFDYSMCFFSMLRQKAIDEKFSIYIIPLCSFCLIRYSSIFSNFLFYSSMIDFCVVRSSNGYEMAELLVFCFLELDVETENLFVDVIANIPLNTKAKTYLMSLLLAQIFKKHGKYIDNLGLSHENLYDSLRKSIIDNNIDIKKPLSKMIIMNKNLKLFLTCDSILSILEPLWAEIENLKTRIVVQVGSKKSIDSLNNELQNLSDRLSVKFAQLVINCHGLFDGFYKSLNMFLRKKELDFSEITIRKNQFINNQMSFDEMESIVNSYYISPFTPPPYIPGIVLPSSSYLHPPNVSFSPQTIAIDYCIFQIEPSIRFNSNIFHGVDTVILKRGCVFNKTNRNVFDEFNEMYGPFDSYCNAIISRYTYHIPSVIFSKFDQIYVLLGSKIISDELCLEDLLSDSLFQSVIRGDFGIYKLFCAHPVLIISEEDLVSSSNYTIHTEKSSILFYSRKSGSIIASFPQRKIPNLFYKVFSNNSINQLTDEWINGKISCLRYLLSINKMSYRSYIDLTSYPIFPRIITNFSLDPCEKRDLSLPIHLAADQENSKKLLDIRYNVQNYHHNDNLSNPFVVSSLLVRISPFCEIQWCINNMWDAEDRSFLSISNQLSISSKTIYENIPELFFLQELYINVNKFSLPNGRDFSIVFPDWITNPYSFLMFHRGVLENDETRSQINAWIDTVFGYKMLKKHSKECYTSFSPLSYISDTISEGQNEWISECGRVPHVVFSSPHPSPVLKEHVPLNHLEIVLSKELNISDPYSNQIQIYTTHQSVYLVSKGSEIAAFFRSGILFSIINNSQMVCASASRTEIVLWSICSGLIIKIIPISSPIHMSFDEEFNTLHVSTSKGIHCYTASGTFITHLPLENISTAHLFSLGFSPYEQFYAVGLSNGELKIFSQSTDSQYKLGLSVQISKYPLTRIVYIPKERKIHFNDSTSFC